MRELGFDIGVFSPCLCFCRATGVGVFRYGDDFVALGRRAAVAEFSRGLGTKLIVKVRGTLGPRPDMGDVSEIVILNRVVKWVRATVAAPEKIELEADARHVPLLAQQMGLNSVSKHVVTPGVKDAGDRGEELDAERRQTYRSAAMRLAYLAQDRPEVAFAAKEIARCMSAPDETAWTALKRAVRFCLGTPRVIWQFERQPPITFLDAWSDSDRAGCLRTRRSTSCTALMAGKHLLRFSSTTQTVVALSSGESEFYGLVKSSSTILGAVAMAKDLGATLAARVRYDATAGAGIANRRGVGRVRHLHTPSLWIQRHVQDGRLVLSKVPGEENYGDLGTKHLDSKKMWKCMNGMGIVARGGRSALSLEVSGGKMA